MQCRQRDGYNVVVHRLHEVLQILHAFRDRLENTGQGVCFLVARRQAPLTPWEDPGHAWAASQLAAKSKRLPGSTWTSGLSSGQEGSSNRRDQAAATGLRMREADRIGSTSLQLAELLAKTVPLEKTLCPNSSLLELT